MYYELYIDALFMVNFAMDVLLLLLVRKILKCQASLLRIVLAGALGAGLYCLIVLLPFANRGFFVGILYVVVSALVVWAGFSQKSVYLFLRAWAAFYIGAFLLGGAYEWLREYAGGVLMQNFLLISVLCYVILSVIYAVYDRYHEKSEKYCKAELTRNGRRLNVTGLWDTGNGLVEPVSRKSVHILELKKAKELLSSQEQKQLLAMLSFQSVEEGKIPVFRYVPYSSVGKKQGMLPVFTVEKCMILQNGEWNLAGMEIAVSKEPLSTKHQYEMIINPGAVKGTANNRFRRKTLWLSR